MNFIFTGCAGAGKTTLINYLSKLGYDCHEEVSRAIIKEQLRLETNAVPWADTVQFCHLVFQEMKKNMPVPSSTINFWDRGIPDLIGYLKAVNHPVPTSYYALLKQSNYAPIVFVFPPSECIYINDDERQESFGEAVKFFEAIAKTYRSLGFSIYTVPLMPLKLRAEFVLTKVASFVRGNTSS